MRKAIVCGSGYGGTYLAAARDLRHEVEVVGLLARGSDRSKAIAGAHNVPLLTRLEEIDRGASLALVAVSPTQAMVELTCSLLDRGLDVVMEHPITTADLETCMEAAKKAERLLHVNGLFAGLDSPRKFIESARQTTAHGPATFVSVLASPRTLYSALEIALLAMGPSVAVDVNPVDHEDPLPIITVATGSVNDVGLIVQIGNWVSAVDDGSDVLIDHRITLGFPTGTLSLHSVAGPVLWSYVPNHFIIDGCTEEHAIWTVLDGPEVPTKFRAWYAQRHEQQKEAIRGVIRHRETGEIPERQREEFLRALVQLYTAS